MGFDIRGGVELETLPLEGEDLAGVGHYNEQSKVAVRASSDTKTTGPREAAAAQTQTVLLFCSRMRWWGRGNEEECHQMSTIHLDIARGSAFVQAVSDGPPTRGCA